MLLRAKSAASDSKVNKGDRETASPEESGTCPKRICTILHRKIAWMAYDMVNLNGVDDAFVDAGVGSKVRERRRTLGMSQSTLAERIGVSFQQIQKYEKGSNRISASKLHQISEILGISLIDLFQVPSTLNRIEPEPVNEILSFVRTVEGQRLNNAFAQVSNDRLRRKIIELVQTLVD